MTTYSIIKGVLLAIADVEILIILYRLYKLRKAGEDDAAEYMAAIIVPFAIEIIATIILITLFI